MVGGEGIRIEFLGSTPTFYPHETPLVLIEFYRVLLDTEEWTSWYNDSSDYKTRKLFKKIKKVNTTAMGLYMVRKHDDIAFVGSREGLSYLVRANYSAGAYKKKSLFHIASQCLAPFMVAFAMKPKSDFLIKFDQQIQRFQENGIINKIMNDINWDVGRISGKALLIGTRSLKPEPPEDRQLTTDDTQGMFLLLGIGVTCAAAALLNECAQGYQCCRIDLIKRKRNTSTGVPSIVLTPCIDDPCNSTKTLFGSKRCASAHDIIRNCFLPRINNARRFSH